jgi:predicted short-subunit dehydrogenase-like oxidoreductase (DUF2520 family)
MIKITLIGSGNLGTQLGLSLVKNGYNIIQVFSKSIENATLLAQKLNSNPINDLSQLKETDLAIICVNDDNITKISQSIHFPQVHTSGTISMNKLNQNFPVGVFYPLQTFSKNNDIEFDQIPICIEASDKSFLKNIEIIASTLSKKVYAINEEKRKKLHLSAVIACNFSNLMYQFANELCAENDIPFEILHKLIEETSIKIKETSPKNAQTGPAKRMDKITIKQHLELLENKTELLEIYNTLTKSIINRK